MVIQQIRPYDTTQHSGAPIARVMSALSAWRAAIEVLSTTAGWGARLRRRTAVTAQRNLVAAITEADVFYLWLARPATDSRGGSEYQPGGYNCWLHLDGGGTGATMLPDPGTIRLHVVAKNVVGYPDACLHLRPDDINGFCERLA